MDIYVCQQKFAQKHKKIADYLRKNLSKGRTDEVQQTGPQVSAGLCPYQEARQPV
jgi:hypothetical protein